MFQFPGFASYCPMCSGSGIPQVKGELEGKIKTNWISVIIAKFVGGVMAIGAGLSLGREGPSIQLGAMVGKGFSRLSGRFHSEERLLMTCGAGAGLAAAFGAPLAGVVFALEELHKNFSTEILLSTMAAAITGDWVASSMFGLKPVFSLDMDVSIPLSHYWMVIILGIILGILGVLYNRCIALSQTFFGSLKPAWMKAVVPFVVIVILAVVYPQALGSGQELVEYAGAGTAGVKILLLNHEFRYRSAGRDFPAAAGTRSSFRRPVCTGGRCMRCMFKPSYYIFCYPGYGGNVFFHSKSAYYRDDTYQ